MKTMVSRNTIHGNIELCTYITWVKLGMYGYLGDCILDAVHSPMHRLAQVALHSTRVLENHVWLSRYTVLFDTIQVIDKSNIETNKPRNHTPLSDGTTISIQVRKQSNLSNESQEPASIECSVLHVSL